MVDNILKKSEYNVFLDNNIVCNLLSQKFLQLNDKLYQYIKANSNFMKNDLGSVFGKLLEYNIITTNEELPIIDYRYNSLKFDKSKASYIVYPTLLCNFNCNYCFETNKKSQLNDFNTELLRNFFINQATSLTELNIRWSGGEPLLAWERIKLISAAILENANNLKYSFSLATNGYYLSESIVNDLFNLHFSTIQVTLDGTPEEHNSIRYTNNDYDTYSKIVAGIKIASKLLPTIIRLNIHDNNVKSFTDFLNNLEKNNVNNVNIEIFVKPIRPKQDLSFSCGLINDEEFNEHEMKFCTIAHEKGFRYSIHPNFKSNIRCLFHHVNSYVIDPNLSLYKCTFDLGDENRRIGKINNLSEIEISNFQYANDCLTYSPVAIAECRNCKVLPICYGKCGLVWNNNNQMKDAGCIPEKKSIKLKLNRFINNER